jgi:membrane fusion protein (multidrug efflux system)
MDQDSSQQRAAAQPPKPAADREHNAAGSANNSRGRRIKAFLIALVLIVAALYSAWRWYSNMRMFVSTDDALIDANRLNVSSRTLGRIVRLGADEGDTVAVGQVLVQLNVNDLLAQSVQAKAALTLAEENVHLARIGLRRAKNDLDRAQVQFKNQTMTAEQFEHAQSDYETAKSKLAIAEAQIGTAKAQIAVIDTSLTNAIVVSPMHGVVSKRWVLPGDVVQPAQPIFSLYNLDSVWVSANLEETKLARVHLGDPVRIHVDAYPDQEFSGRVLQIGTNTAAQFSLIPPNNASGNFTKVTQRVPVKMSIVRAAPVSLLPGMSAAIRVKV